MLCAAAAALLIAAYGASGLNAAPLQDHGQYTASQIDIGTRVYRGQCESCHGPLGNLVSGVDLRRGQFKRVTSDADLARVITEGLPGAGMPPFALHPGELTGIVAFIRAGFDPDARAVRIGSAPAGRAIVEGTGECLMCHRIGTAGSRVAPDLTDIALARPADALLRSLTDPISGMLPINRPVRITMKDGKTVITGRRLNEDTYTVQIIDDKEKLHSIAKSDMKAYVVETKSPMPSYAGRLTEDEIADVIAYLLTLRGR